MSVLAELFKHLTLSHSKLPLRTIQHLVISVRYLDQKPKPPRDKRTFVDIPKPGQGQAFRRLVHFPENNEYTVEPLKTTHLGGRDPVTGRKVCEGIGGGVKHKYHWPKWTRDGPSEGPPREEKVIRIIKCGCRTANLALVAVENEMKYILATANMKPGDIIKTSKFIPRNPVEANEGDAYPLGALPLGTLVHNVQISPDNEYTIIHSAGNFGVVKKHLDKKVLILLPKKREMLLDPRCMATVGRLSNIEHESTPIGSAVKSRELGNRPRSGLWHRKTGRHGRKIKPPQNPHEYTPPKPKKEYIQCTHPHIKI